MHDRALLRHTSLRRYVDGVDWIRFGAAVSLHAHTYHSREVMSDLPAYITKIPFVGPRFDSEVARRRGTDEEVDFSKGWWHPPIAPRALFDSETAQIDARFGLRSIVSLTDHDDIAAGLELQHWFAPDRAPVSFERLASFTAGTSTEALADILNDLIDADVLIVFNHPLWDLAAVGDETHAV